MSALSRWLERWRRSDRNSARIEPDTAPAPPPAPSEQPAKRSDNSEIDPLRDVVPSDPRQVSAAIDALRRARGTLLERAALEAIFEAHARARLPGTLVVAAADILIERGAIHDALRLLDGSDDAGALVLCADLRAQRGELGYALALLERVLARDIAAPGVRERYQRYRRELGGGESAPVPTGDATLLRPTPPKTSWRIIAEAGRGGSGVVYEAIDDVLGRKLALKLYHRPERERDKLEREARLAVRLAGEGIVRIFDADAGQGYIAMEWVGGGALKPWIVERRAVLWPLDRWVVPLVRAVARVHASGLVHADVKPHNVLFRGIEEPVLSDFSLAQAPGVAVTGGSLGYLSPERLSQQPLRFDDDVYALGRIIEDALFAVSRDREPDPSGALWQRVASAAIAPRGVRPPHGAELLDFAHELGLGSTPHRADP